MKKILFTLTAILAATVSTYAQQASDTIRISYQYTTHLVFANDVAYCNLSENSWAKTKIVDKCRNKVAIKAFSQTDATTSLFIEESNGVKHSYIVVFDMEPERLIYDQRPGKKDIFYITDTIEVTKQYTTHINFENELIYVDVSSPAKLKIKFADNGKNKLAVSAWMDFKGEKTSISVEEANGIFRTFIIRYNESSPVLLFDYTNNRDPKRCVFATTLGKRKDAPKLDEVMAQKRSIYHLYGKQYKIHLAVENINSYSDIIYVVLGCENKSHISYQCNNAVFVIETGGGLKRMVKSEVSLFPKNQMGTLTAPAESYAKMVYAFNKFTLSDDQVMKIYMYEEDGGRNVVLTLTAKDINDAITPLKRNITPSK